MSSVAVRFAPSPTGFMHIGGIYASLINKKVAEQSGGVFFLRIEDTDTKRFIEGAIETIVDGLARFGLSPDEGVVGMNGGVHVEKGDYGPYVQTHRAGIYRAFAADLVRRELAYPCFCTEENLQDLRNRQREGGVARSGYYGEWARCRHRSVEDALERLADGIPFVVRLRAPGDYDRRIEWTDSIRGRIAGDTESDGRRDPHAGVVTRER